MTRGVKGSRSPHGTRTRCQQGCHCEPCREAMNAYMRRNRGTEGKAPAWGMQPIRAVDREPDFALTREELLAFRASSAGNISPGMVTPRP